MENHLKSASDISKEIDKIHKEIQPALYEYNSGTETDFEAAEKDLNTKILEITMKIKDQYPELSKYLEEMTVTIPDKKHPEVTLKSLKAYYESLNSILLKYKQEHPAPEK